MLPDISFRSFKRHKRTGSTRVYNEAMASMARNSADRKARLSNIGSGSPVAHQASSEMSAAVSNGSATKG
jgi:hypothetical protein